MNICCRENPKEMDNCQKFDLFCKYSGIQLKWLIYG